MYLKKLSLFFVLLLFSCDDIYDSIIPSYQVKAELRLNTMAQQLTTPGGYHTITKIDNLAPYIGFGGVLVLHGLDGNFYAYDMACPVENNPNTKIEIKNSLSGVCPKCGSEFDQIMYGYDIPTSGTAAKRKLKLRKYYTNYNSENNIVTVYN